MLVTLSLPFQTVLDDARLFLLEGSCSSEEKACTLASVGLLSVDSCRGGSMRRGNLLSMYLEGADLLLDTTMEGLGERNTQMPQEAPAGI